MATKLSDTMLNELRYAAQEGYQGEMVYAGRKTEDALRRRGLITNDYDNATFATSKWGYRNPVLTVAGWAVIGERPADRGRYSLEEAWQEAHADIDHVDPTDDNEENDNVTIKEGPLTERQWAVLRGVSCGHRYVKISRDLGVSEVTVKQEVRNIVAKLGTETIAQAVARSATANAYRMVADLLDKHSREHPQADGIAEDHVNHVLMQLAEMYRERAERILPQ